MNFQHQQYYEELKQLAAQVEESKRNESTIMKHLDSTALRNELENKRLYKELEETREIGGNTLRDAEGKLNKFKGTYAETLEGTSQKYSHELTKEQQRLETVARKRAAKTFLREDMGIAAP